jgi:hypothetical protein
MIFPLDFCYKILNHPLWGTIWYYRLSYYHIIILSFYHKLYHHITMLSYYHIIILSYYRIIILSSYHILYHHIIMLSYYSPTIFGNPKKDPSQRVASCIHLGLTGPSSCTFVVAWPPRLESVGWAGRVGCEAGFSNGFIVEENCLSGYKWCI